MKAEEIRQKFVEAFGNRKFAQIPVETAKVYFFAEIAAQLAELNETLNSLIATRTAVTVSGSLSQKYLRIET